MTKRQQNIIKRMLAGEYYYSGGSPRMSKSEYRDLCDMGFRIQLARPRFESTHYFLMKEFEQENKTLYHNLLLTPV